MCDVCMVRGARPAARGCMDEEEGKEEKEGEEEEVGCGELIAYRCGIQGDSFAQVWRPSTWIGPSSPEHLHVSLSSL